MFEWRLVAKEESFVCRHRFDDRGHECVLVRRFERGDEFAEIGKAGPARDRQEPAFDQILLVGREHEARALLEALAQEIVVEWRHERAPEKSRMIFGAI